MIHATAFFERHGPRTIVLARFVPVVRTFVPTLAGAAHMHYRRFIAYNVIGGMAWATGVPLAGYLLGKTVPSIDRYLLPVIALVVAASLIPVALEARRHRAAEAA